MTVHPDAEVLSAYLDSETTAEERDQVTAHLSSCVVCQTHLKELKLTANLFHALEPFPAPAGFRQSVRAKLRHLPILHGVFRLQWPPTRRVLAAASALVLVGLFSVNLLQHFQPREEAVRDARQSFERGVPAAQSADTKATDRASRTASQITGFVPSGRQVIRTASLITTVRDVDEAARTLTDIAESNGGFVANSTLIHQHPSYGTFELRIPVTQFTRALDAIDRVGEVRERQFRGQDVSEEFVDLQARVRNLERHEHQLLTFMDRATKVVDLMAIEQELARVRGQIEQLTGRLRFINNQVDLATVSVTLQERERGTPGLWNFPASLEKIQAAFINTVRQVLAGAEWLGVLVGALIPVALLAFPTWILVRRLARRRMQVGDQQKGQ